MSRLYLVAPLVALLPAPLLACECGPLTPAEAFDQADFVFVGTPLPDSEGTAWLLPGERVWLDSFDVDEWLKGGVEALSPSDLRGVAYELQTVTVATSALFACGVGFSEGVRYVVFARGGYFGLAWTDACWGTVEAEEAAPDLPGLRDAAARLPPPSSLPSPHARYERPERVGPERDPEHAPWLAAVVGLSLAANVALATALWRALWLRRVVKIRETVSRQRVDEVRDSR